MCVFALFRLRVEEGKEGLEKSKIDSGLGSDDSARDEIESETASKTSAKISHVDVVICYWLLAFTTNVFRSNLQKKSGSGAHLLRKKRQSFDWNAREFVMLSWNANAPGNDSRKEWLTTGSLWTKNVEKVEELMFFAV